MLPPDRGFVPHYSPVHCGTLAHPALLRPCLLDSLCHFRPRVVVLGRWPSDGNVWFQTVHMRLDADPCFDLARSGR